MGQRAADQSPHSLHERSRRRQRECNGLKQLIRTNREGMRNHSIFHSHLSVTALPLLLAPAFTYLQIVKVLRPGCTRPGGVANIASPSGNAKSERLLSVQSNANRLRIGLLMQQAAQQTTQLLLPPLLYVTKLPGLIIPSSRKPEG